MSRISNEILPEVERQHVRAALRDATLELGNIDAKMGQLVVQLAELSRKRAKHLAHIDTLRCAIAPHKYLPPEIIARIFVFCLDPTSEEAIIISRNIIDEPHHFPLRIPWTLGHVCSRWRRIALSEPRLWNSIFFQGRAADTHILEQALNRSGRSKVLLRVTGIDFGCFHHVISPHYNRLGTLKLLTSSGVIRQFLMLPPGLFGALEHVELTLTRSSTPRFDIQPDEISVFREANNLRHFMFGFAGVPPPLRLFLSFPLSLRLPWSSLTILRLLTPIDIRIAHQLLAWCYSLQECKVLITRFELGRISAGESAYIASINIHRSYQQAEISLPNLRILDVNAESQSDSYLYAFMAPLHIPMLERFDFSLSGAPGWAFEDLASLFNRPSHSNFRSTITLKHTGSEFMDIGRLAPLYFLTSIHAPNIPVQRPALTKMVNEDWFPRLTSLCACIMPEDMDLFVDLLKARWSQSLKQSDTYPGITNAIIFVADRGQFAEYSAKINEIQEELGITDAMITLM
jgi:hypothetical protein